jgi:methylthioxylose transferase
VSISADRFGKLRPAVLGLLAIGTLWWSFDRGAPFRTDENLRFDVKVEAAPLIGRWVWKPTVGLLLPLLIGALTIFVLPKFQSRLSFGRLSALSGVLTGAFSVTLAGAEGWNRIMDPVVHKSEYWFNLDTLPSLSETLSSWSTKEFLLYYSVHLRGHPPGFILLLQMIEKLMLVEPWMVATLIWVSLAAVAPGVMACVERLSDETIARQLAPFLILSPYAIWMATSADAFYACLLIWGTAFLTFAMSASRSIRRVGYAVAGGLLLAFALYCTYGAAMFLGVPLLVVLFVKGRSVLQRLQVAVAAAAAASAVAVGFKLAGFWWFDGLARTKNFYHIGTAQFRPWQYFIVANVGALIIAVGPAVVVGLGRLGRSRLWILVAGAAIAIIASDVSTYSKAETERIWLIFMPMLLPVTAALPKPRIWLALQLGLGLLLQAWLRSKW